MIAWETRRRYIELAARYAGYHVDNKQIDLPADNPESDAERLEKIFARAAARPVSQNPADPAEHSEKLFG